MKKHVLVTGGAGFIGSHVSEKLIALNYNVVVYDNLSTGFKRFLENIQTHDNFTFIEGDLLDTDKLNQAMKNIDFVFHMAANADVRFGTQHPAKDLQQNTIATFNVLEAMRKNDVRKIVFSSTGSVYGEASIFPTPENAPFPVQTSLYAASKLACEGLISSYCEGFDFQSWIFRFVSVLGERYSHGHVYDFYQKLSLNPNELAVLGDGKQKKSYMYVKDCIDAILIAIENADDKVNLFNLGRPDYIDVNASISHILKQLNLSPKIIYSGGARGWIGDNPFIFLETNRIQSLGWSPKKSIKEGITMTLDWLRENQWVYEARK